MNIKNLKYTSFEKTIITLILIAGALISISQFFYNRSLWLDEATLSLNIINKNYAELLKPLDYKQVAPILFLLTEKLFSVLIPNSEYGLRLFPLISFLLSLFLFYKIIKIIHKNDYTIIFSLSLFVFNVILIFYSSEVKQYMSDVLVLTSVFYFVLKQCNDEIHKYYYLGFIGAISIFLSNVAPIILFTAGLYLFIDIYSKKDKKLQHLIVISIVWILLFLLYFIKFIHNHPTRDAQLTFFGNAFMPINPLSINFYKFLIQKEYLIVNSLFPFGRIGGIFLSVIIFAGFVSLIRNKKTDIIILTITPLILHLLFSCLKLYPFSLRLITYIFPGIIVICSYGFEYFVNMLQNVFKIERFSLLAISIPLLMSYSIYRVEFPIKIEEIKNSIKYIEQNMGKKDKVYVSYFAGFPFKYYQDISFIKIDTNNIIIENKWLTDTSNSSNALSLLKGRVWLLFIHAQIEDEIMNEKFLVNYINPKSKGIIQEFHTKGSDVYLYDIN